MHHTFVSLCTHESLKSELWRFDGEFGMPSTHAMMWLSLPVSIIVFTASKPYWLLTVFIGL